EQTNSPVSPMQLLQAVSSWETPPCIGAWAERGELTSVSDRLPLYVGMVRIIQRYLTTHLGLALSLSSQAARQVPTSSLLRFRAINNSLTSRMQEQVIESQTCSRRRAQWPQTASMRRKSRWHKTHNRGTLHFRNWS